MAFSDIHYSLQYSVLPKEILGEILNEVVADPSTSLTELSNLSLVCREWNKFVSDSNIWLKMVNLKWMKIKSKATDLHIHKIFQSTARLFTPKLSYALLNYRIPIYNYYANGSVLGDVVFREFPADLIKLRSNKLLWVPWLNHNILERPETLWKFIYTTIRYPKWIHPLLAYWTPDPTHRNSLDPFAIRQVDKKLSTIAVCTFNYNGLQG
jgi:hypothetical protein